MGKGRRVGALASGGEGDDFEDGAVLEGVVAVFFAEEGLAVEFDDEGFAEEVFRLEEVEEADGGHESFCFAVELDGHGVNYGEARMDSSQSFQMGSKWLSRRSCANSAGERVSSMVNWGVALWQEEDFSSASSSTRRPLMVRWRSFLPAPV